MIAEAAAALAFGASSEDIAITKKLVKAGELLNIAVTLGAASFFPAEFFSHLTSRE